jgi:hypothetical protein
MSRVAKDAITKEYLKDNAIRLEDIDHGNYKFFNKSTIENIIAITAKNDCEVKNTTGAQTSITFQLSIVIDYNLHDVMQLAFYGWKVSRIKDNKVALISFRAMKLQALSKHIGNIDKFHSISINRYDGNDLMETINGKNKDIIKACQKSDRHFNVRMVTDRKDDIKY